MCAFLKTPCYTYPPLRVKECVRPRSVTDVRRARALQVTVTMEHLSESQTPRRASLHDTQQVHIACLP